MGEKDFLVDAVAQYLQTNAWQDMITRFFAAHCAKFPLEAADEKLSKGVGYSLEQFDVFTQFKDLMERLLESMMGELGCSGEELVEILQESTHSGLSGERRFLIKTLLSFEDYVDFHARISEYAAQEQQQPTDGEEACTEMSEWQKQLAVAQSLLDAHAQGLLDETEQNFLLWAEALVGMGQSNHSGELVGTQRGEDKGHGDEVKVSSEPTDQTREMEYSLIKERLKVDLLVAQRLAASNVALKKEMLHLSAVEVAQSEDQEEKSAEHDLDGLFTQLETVRERLKIVKAHCFEFKQVNQEAMDQLYLYLKEKIHYQHDLVAQEKEISDSIFSLIEQSDAALIPLLLEWLLLESEGLRVQRQIQEELGQGHVESGPTEDEGFWTQSWDENAQAFFYFHSVSGNSVWEPPSVGFYDANQEYCVPELAAGDISCETHETAEGGDQSGLPLSLCIAGNDFEERISVSTMEAPTAMYEMEQILDKISREHDEERKRLELIFELEKARQKEELRRRKEKKRRDKHLKKKKKQEREGLSRQDGVAREEIEAGSDAKEEGHSAASAQIPIAERPMLSTKAEAKADERSTRGNQIPGRGRLRLTHLLSEGHAKRQLERNGLSVPLAPTAQVLLNPTSLRYLAETLAKKHPEGWMDDSPTSLRPPAPTELLLEEADDKEYK